MKKLTRRLKLPSNQNIIVQTISQISFEHPNWIYNQCYDERNKQVALAAQQGAAPIASVKTLTQIKADNPHLSSGDAYLLYMSQPGLFEEEPANPPSTPPSSIPEFIPYTISSIPSSSNWNNFISNSQPPLEISYNQEGELLGPNYDEHEIEMPTPKKKISTLQNKHYNKKISTWLPASRLTDGEIGLEIECEGTNLFNAPISYWTCHQDHSLRAAQDGSPPIEYVLKKPLNRKELDKALLYLSTKLKQTGSTIDDSTRTSVHVHLNCQKYTVQEVYKIICMYIIYEELLTEWCGKDRVGNLFCLRSKDAEYFLNCLEQAVISGKYNQILQDEYRYSACNTASLKKFGSLEFRTMRGTVDVQVIRTWVDILVGLKDKALSFDNPRSIVELFQRIGPLAFYEQTFPIRSMFVNHQNLSGSMWDGLRLMRDVAYAVKWEPKINEPEEEKLPVDRIVFAGPYSDNRSVPFNFGSLSLNKGDIICFDNNNKNFWWIENPLGQTEWSQEYNHA